MFVSVGSCTLEVFNAAHSCPQEFFSLAWSTVLMSSGSKASAQRCSILAAGGKRGLVKLIHPRNNVAYGEFRASRKSVAVVRFNQQQGNFLFSESWLLTAGSVCSTDSAWTTVVCLVSPVRLFRRSGVVR